MDSKALFLIGCVEETGFLLVNSGILLFGRIDLTFDITGNGRACVTDDEDVEDCGNMEIIYENKLTLIKII